MHAQQRGQLVLTIGEPGIRQAEPDHLGIAGPEKVKRCRRLLLAQLADDRRIGVRMRPFAVSNGDEPQAHPGCGEQGHGAAGAEDLVVGMSGHDRDARPRQYVSLGKLAQVGPAAPGLLGSAGAVDAGSRGLPPAAVTVPAPGARACGSA